MTREVRRGANGDDPLSKIAKLIPAEVTAAYLAINNNGPDPTISWTDPRVLLPFLFLWLMCPVLLRFVQRVNNRLQIAVTTLLFPIWAINIGPGHFGLDPSLAANFLILSTLLLPFVPAGNSDGGDANNGGGAP